MKMKTSLVAALLLGMPAISSAFTLDFAGYQGGDLSTNPVSIFVPGYGELVFQAAVGNTLVVNSAYENDNGFGGPSLNFDQNDAIKITFNGLEPLDVDFDFVGVSAGESFVVQKDLFTPQAFLLTLQGGGDGAGLYAISWNTQAIPEPTSALLGLIGTAAFAFRRRR
ncbi:MAG: PEP-CTERM sorting domain-containing protein [Verrucomicrobiota bacterium]